MQRTWLLSSHSQHRAVHHQNQPRALDRAPFLSSAHLERRCSPFSLVACFSRIHSSSNGSCISFACSPDASVLQRVLGSGPTHALGARSGFPGRSSEGPSHLPVPVWLLPSFENGNDPTHQAQDCSAVLVCVPQVDVDGEVSFWRCLLETLCSYVHAVKRARRWAEVWAVLAEQEPREVVKEMDEVVKDVSRVCGSGQDHWP